MSGETFIRSQLAPASRYLSSSLIRSPSSASDGRRLTSMPFMSADDSDRGDVPRPSGGSSPQDRCAVSGGTYDRFIHLTYVSECRIPSNLVAADLKLILAHSIQHNRRDNITGALLFTGTRFVGTLEGSAAIVDDLMKSIGRDRRHANLLVIDRRTVSSPIFTSWSLAYKGPSLFVEKIVARALAGFQSGTPHDVSRLLQLMAEFGGGPDVKQTP